MKTKYIITLLAILYISITNAQVTSEFDKDFNFSTIKTFSFSGWSHDSDDILLKTDKDAIISSLRNELKARGLTYKEKDADVRITLYIVVLSKNEGVSYSAYNTGMGYYSAWGYGTQHYSYKESNNGTFAISMFSEETKKLIWQGVITSVVKDKPSKREKSIPKKIHKLMLGYPLKAKK